MAKLQGFTVTQQAFANIAKSAGNVPQSAVFRNAYFDPERNVFVCLFEDDAFEDVREGNRFPIDVANATP